MVYKLPKGEEGMECCNWAKFKCGLKNINVMSADTACMPPIIHMHMHTCLQSKYSISCFHIWILSYTVLVCRMHALFLIHPWWYSGEYTCSYVWSMCVWVRRDLTQHLRLTQFTHEVQNLKDKNFIHPIVVLLTYNVSKQWARGGYNITGTLSCFAHLVSMP